MLQRDSRLFPLAFTYYTIGMSKREMIKGVPVTEEQISEWVAEAEAGYDVEALKKRGRGRPGRDRRYERGQRCRSHRFEQRP